MDQVLEAKPVLAEPETLNTNQNYLKSPVSR